MTRPLALTDHTNIDEITKFFADAGPDARVRARQNTDGSGVELYVRDLSLKGRLQEWWDTNSDERKNCYQHAKSSIESIILNSNKRNEHYHFNSIFEAHKQDFVGGEILGLQQQLKARNEIGSGLDKAFPRQQLTVQGQAKPSRLNQSKFDDMATNLRQTDPNRLVNVLRNLSDKKYSRDELHQNLKEFKKFVELNCTKSNSGNEDVEIDFVSAKKFLNSLTDIFKNIEPILNSDSEQQASTLRAELSVLGGDTWVSLTEWAENIPKSSDHEAY